jgi:hypothetical protein
MSLLVKPTLEAAFSFFSLPKLKTSNLNFFCFYFYISISFYLSTTLIYEQQFYKASFIYFIS